MTEGLLSVTANTRFGHSQVTVLLKDNDRGCEVSVVLEWDSQFALRRDVFPDFREYSWDQDNLCAVVLESTNGTYSSLADDWDRAGTTVGQLVLTSASSESEQDQVRHQVDGLRWAEVRSIRISWPRADLVVEISADAPDL